MVVKDVYCVEGVFQLKSYSIVRRILAALMVVMLLAGTATAFAASPKGSYYCTANRVNVRSGPSSGYSSQYKLMKGDVVTYISRSNGWYKVSYFDKGANSVETGYVYRGYLSSVGSSSSSSKSTSTGSTYRTTANLRVRSQPSVDQGYVITKLKKGTKVKVQKQKHSWAYVAYKGGYGWVSAKYLKRV